MTDPIADMLTRIRNAIMASRESVVMPHSNIKEAIIKILVEKSYVSSYSVSGEIPAKVIEVKLGGRRELTKLTRMSKPGRRVYTSSTEIPMVLSGRGLVIISTPKGIMAGGDAKKAGLGGELICKVW